MIRFYTNYDAYGGFRADEVGHKEETIKEKAFLSNEGINKGEYRNRWNSHKSTFKKKMNPLFHHTTQC